MADDRPDLGNYIDEFHLDAMKIVDHAREAADHYKRGDLQATCVGLHLDYVAGPDMNMVSRRAGSVVGSPPLPSARPAQRG